MVRDYGYAGAGANDPTGSWLTGPFGGGWLSAEKGPALCCLFHPLITLAAVGLNG